MNSGKHLILAGGGHSHLAVLKAFARNPLSDLKLTLVSPERRTAYSGALSAWMAGQIPGSQLYIDLESLARKAGAQLITGNLTHLDAENNRITLGNGEDIDYDTLSLNTGSTPQLSSLPGADLHGCPVKPIAGFVKEWSQLLHSIRTSPDREHSIVFVGAGVAGCELAITAANTLKSVCKAAGGISSIITVHLVSDQNAPATSMNAGFQQKLHKAMHEAGVVFHASTTVTSVTKEGINTGKGHIPAHPCFITTQASAPRWASASALAADEKGFILVNNMLQSLSHHNVFAAGDIATLVNRPVAKSGVYAVRQGPVLGSNLRRSFAGQKLLEYHAQKHALVLAHTGLETAIAGRGHWSAQGKLWWKLKHYLDKQFVNRYS